MDSLEETDKFPEMYSLPRLNQEETENTNRSVTSEVESIMENSQQTSFQHQRASQVNSTKHLEKSKYQPSNYSKKLQRKECFALILQNQHQPEYSKSDKDTKI